MSIVRAIHPRYYSKEERRFKSPAFESSDDGGISVFSSDCAIRLSGTICEHLNVYYVSIDVAGIPTIYWEFDEGILPSVCHREMTIGAGEDPCHENIKGLNKNQSRQFFKRQTSNNLALFRICDPLTGARPLTELDIS